MINLDNFIYPQTEKYVLQLKDNNLKCVPLKGTSLFDRVLAWFGYGPLSLGNITKFIADNVQEVEKLSALYPKLDSKISLYNSRHSFNKVSLETITSLSKTIPLVTYAFAQKDSTKNSNRVGNFDFSYADPEAHFGYVVDVDGHDHTTLWSVPFNILNVFNRSYPQKLKEKAFTYISDVNDFLSPILTSLSSIITETLNFPYPDKTVPSSIDYQPPAMCFAQIIRFNNQSYLFSFEQKGATLLIRKPDGSLTRANQGEEVNFTLLSPGDTVIGFSKGIGEYLMFSEMKEVIDREKNYDNLLQSFKNRIIQIGVAEKSTKKRYDEFIAVNLSKPRKLYTANHPRFTADMSLFILTCGK